MYGTLYYTIFEQVKLLASRVGVVPVPYDVHLTNKRQAVLGAAAVRLATHALGRNTTTIEAEFIDFALGIWDKGWSQFAQDKFVLPPCLKLRTAGGVCL